MVKEKRYTSFLSDTALLIQDEHDEISVLANVSAALKEAFGFFWVGFYLVKEKEGSAPQLYLGPFQGPTACYRIGYGRGVCGSAWQQRQSLVVPDVEEFPGHIACSSLSRSEIVVPIFNHASEVVGVLDIDSTELATFDNIDRHYLEQLCQLLTENLY
jgi:GAF domain-containing protein